MDTKYDKTFETRLRALGYGVRCMWQVPGPVNTMVAGMECLAVYADDVAPRIFIVQTFEGGGWDAYATVSDENNIDATIDAAVATIKREPSRATA